VLGLDQDVIARGIELKYRELSVKDNERSLPIDGARYLEKIIQLPFLIPPIEQANMSQFLQSLGINWPDVECPDVFAVGFRNNPRQVKRAANIFLMLWSLAQQRGQTLIQPLRLAKVIAIQATYPELYDLIKNHPVYLQKLENYYRTRPVDDEMPAPMIDKEHNEIQESIAIPLPPALAKYSSQPVIQAILCMHSSEKANANFVDLDAQEISVYFTLTRGIEAPKIASQDQREEKRYDESATELLHIPIAGRIVAGVPAPVPPSDRAYYDAESSLSVARSLLPINNNTGDLYALEVQGDSMIDAMVNDGDYVIMKPIEKESEVHDGEMVAIWLPKRDETSLTHIYKEKNGYRLQPANPTMKPIMVTNTEPLEVKGKVVMVIRRIADNLM
jgi:repressor LexA